MARRRRERPIVVRHGRIARARVATDTRTGPDVAGRDAAPHPANEATATTTRRCARTPATVWLAPWRRLNDEESEIQLLQVRLG
jgi:hypothetical protein